MILILILNITYQKETSLINKKTYLINLPNFQIFNEYFP